MTYYDSEYFKLLSPEETADTEENLNRRFKDLFDDQAIKWCVYDFPNYNGSGFKSKNIKKPLIEAWLTPKEERKEKALEIAKQINILKKKVEDAEEILDQKMSSDPLLNIDIKKLISNHEYGEEFEEYCKETKKLTNFIKKNKPKLSFLQDKFTSLMYAQEIRSYFEFICPSFMDPLFIKRSDEKDKIRRKKINEETRRIESEIKQKRKEEKEKQKKEKAKLLKEKKVKSAIKSNEKRKDNVFEVNFKRNK